MIMYVCGYGGGPGQNIGICKIISVCMLLTIYYLFLRSARMLRFVDVFCLLELSPDIMNVCYFFLVGLIGFFNKLTLCITVATS